MSVVDKVIAAFAPPEDDEQRAEARAKARAAATPGDWLSLVLKHHGELEALFAGVKSATTAEAQRQAEKRLGVMLVGHAIAEESVLYPALARAGENHQAGLGYTEQAAVKMQMAELERLTPLNLNIWTRSAISRARYSITCMRKKEPGFSTSSGPPPLPIRKGRQSGTKRNSIGTSGAIRFSSRDTAPSSQTPQGVPAWLGGGVKREGRGEVTPIAPMEARLVAELPHGPEWQFEPKWDGFRAIVVREADDVVLWSKSGKRLDRYFPELVARVRDVPSQSFVLDGEIIIPVHGILSFGSLQARLHPAASRITRLAQETPAQLMLFDILRSEGASLSDQALAVRRRELERFLAHEHGGVLRLSPATRERDEAVGWLRMSGGALDGVVAKLVSDAYRHGERAMAKIKQIRTADCVVGGFRHTNDGTGVASLLLGLYDDDGSLNHVGFSASLDAADKQRLLPRLEKLAGGSGFTGRTPGGPSRWNDGKESAWTALEPTLVVEVQYDQVTDRRFRHGTKIVRWRRDKRADQCTMDQLRREMSPAELTALIRDSSLA